MCYSSLGLPNIEVDNDNDIDVFTPTGGPTTLTYQVDAKHRRATVSGGSPTGSQPFIDGLEEDIDIPVPRHKAYTISTSSPSSEGSASVISPESESVFSPDDIRLKVPGTFYTMSYVYIFTPHPLLTGTRFYSWMVRRQ